MPEKHELSFEEFDARVEVEDDGRVWVSFHESSKCAFTLSASDLSLVAAFVEKHATSSWWIVSHSTSTAATGLDFPFRETFEELIALAKQWEGEAKDAQDSMERVVLKGCARRLREVIDVLD